MNEHCPRKTKHYALEMAVWTGVCLDMDLNRKTDQAQDQTIGTFALQRDMCTMSGLVPPTPLSTETNTPLYPSLDLTKSLTDGCTGKIHSGDKNLLRHCLSNVWI